MTVLIAAAGDPGETASAALTDREVVRAETLASAREALPGVDVVVVGPLAEGSPATLRDAARIEGVPVVPLDAGAAADLDAGDPVDPEAVGALRNAVDLAERADEYRDAVDSFYERARAYADDEVDADDRDLRAARDRAHRRLRDIREAAGRTPYERLLADEDAGGGDVSADDTAETEDADGDEGEDASGPTDGVAGAEATRSGDDADGEEES